MEEIKNSALISAASLNASKWSVVLGCCLTLVFGKFFKAVLFDRLTFQLYHRPRQASPLMRDSSEHNLTDVLYLLAACGYECESARATSVNRYAYYNDKLHWVIIVNLRYGAKMETRLMMQCKRGNVDGVKRLISLGADVNARNANGESALFIASEIFLLNGGNIDGSQISSGSLLPSWISRIFWFRVFHSSSRLSQKIVDILIKAGANVNIEDDVFGSSCLMRAGCSGNSLVIRDLIAVGADVNRQDRSGRTALMFSLARPECVSTLIELGAHVDVADLQGWTPLMYASGFGRVGSMKALIAAGADLNKANTAGETALLRACTSGFLNAVRLLIKSGADVNARDAGDETCLLIAAREGFENILVELMKAGADLNWRSARGDSALRLARDWGNFNCVRLLFAAGAVRLPQDGEDSFFP